MCSAVSRNLQEYIVTGNEKQVSPVKRQVIVGRGPAVNQAASATRDDLQQQACATAKHSSNHILTSAGATTTEGFVGRDDELAYKEEVQQLTDRCKVNSPPLNVDKTKEMVVDFMKGQSDHSLLIIDRTCGNRHECQVPWYSPSGEPLMDPQHQLHSQGREAVTLLTEELEESSSSHHHPHHILQSILSTCFTTWFWSCTILDLKTQEQTAQH
ncbi:hypothetical protein P4O66_021228 [Electrophorus voltai]|uniref:Uncharacterized protein n=1 Tax=Electrophorus voltai TaxID=2609070 RepID=A0AAD9E3K8_9TELE|nr:hypothetical protein P4O66_021228 [Electrophorus voltai]